MDMNKKRLFLLSGLIITITVGIGLYWLYFSKPDGLPDDKKLIDYMNRYHSDMQASDIKAIIPADEEHVFVPFVRKGGEYGASFWTWRKRDWELDYISSAGEPKIWRIDPDDPSSFRIAWSFSPDSGLEKIRYYLMRDRDFFVSGGKETYLPKVQMEHETMLDEGSYGMMELPEEWKSVAGSLADSVKKSQPDWFSFPVLGIHFGWIGYDENGKTFFPDVGDSFGTGGSNIDYMQMLGENDIEQPGRKE